MTINDRKLIKSGEYMTIFNEKFKVMKQKNNMHLLTKE